MIERERLWPRALLWLVALGAFFFLSYGAANNYAAGLSDVPVLAYAWELEWIPFVPALMLPYMSVDLFYAISLFLPRTRKELDTHALRLGLTTLIGVVCFFLFPAQSAFVRPPVDGFNGFLLDMLNGFDKPFNQAPSLHIALLIILWVQYAKHLSSWARRALDIWFTLIALSVLGTWQHHVIDVVTGAALGVIVLYFFPEQRPRRYCRVSYRKMERVYGAASCLFLALAWINQSLLLLWPAATFGILYLAYTVLGTRMLAKQDDGTRPIAAAVLLLPYILIAHVSQRILMRRHPQGGGVLDRIHLVPWPGPATYDCAVLDLCAELARKNEYAHYRCVPMLDLAPPTSQELDEAIEALTELKQTGLPVYVHCALGRGRCAAVLVAWLLSTKQAHSVEEAVKLVLRHCPHCVIPSTTIKALEGWWNAR